MCFVVQHEIRLSSDIDYIWIELALAKSLVPESLKVWLTSEHGWYGIIANDWPNIKQPRFEISVKPQQRQEWTYKISQTDHYFRSGKDDFISCYSNFIKEEMGHCKQCFPLVFTFLPGLLPYNSTEEIKCLTYNLKSRKGRYDCLNLKTQIEMHVDASLDRIEESNLTQIAWKIYGMKETKIVKEEVLVDTTENLIGSVGGSLGLFLGFSFFTYLSGLLEKFMCK